MRYQLSDIPPDWRLLRLGAGLGTVCGPRVFEMFIFVFTLAAVHCVHR